MTNHLSQSPQNKRARIALVATGGTIAGAAATASDSVSYRAGALNIATLQNAVPGLAELADIQAEQFASIDSKDADLSFWCDLAKRVNVLLASDEIDGVVVTHGTDTLEETAYWLNLTIASDKPIVLTAAMRPATALSADGPANLFDAVTLAASPQARGQGVLLAFANRVHAARDVAKVSGHAVDAFASTGLGPLGWVQDGKVTIARHSNKRHTFASEFAQTAWTPEKLAAVGVIVSYAGVSGNVVAALRQDGVRGIVVAGTGNGSLHTHLLQALSNASQTGLAVVRSSRTADIRVSEGGAVDDQQLGFVASGTLNPYKARILLMLALSSGPTERARLSALFAEY